MYILNLYVYFNTYIHIYFKFEELNLYPRLVLILPTSPPQPPECWDHRHVLPHQTLDPHNTFSPPTLHIQLSDKYYHISN